MNKAKYRLDAIEETIMTMPQRTNNEMLPPELANILLDLVEAIRDVRQDLARLSND